MSHPSELLLRDVRCFEGTQRGRLRPITLLVGENSTGKTTFLGCYATLHRLLAPWGDSSPDFNRDPFTMGAFRDIVRSRLGPKGRINEFGIGFRASRPTAGFPPYNLVATFREQGSQPTISSYRYDFDNGAFLLARASKEGRTTLAIEGRRVALDVPWEVAPQLLTSSIEFDWLTERFPEAKPIAELITELSNGKPRNSRQVDWRLFGVPQTSSAVLIPLAPLRAKPERAYNPVTERATPEGAHVPMFMMRLHHSEQRSWTHLRDSLVEFGRDSGLFSDIKIKRHGKQISDPFQIEVKVQSSSAHNLTDVGYGVSQSLPILVDLLSAEETVGGHRHSPERGPLTFMLQQPEVHLHPRGQAALASLFAGFLARARKRRRQHRVLIETHSDYIIDRFRILVRDGRIRADDMAILYFEPLGNSVKLHNIRVDSDGNLVNTPAGYRDFFLRETDRLLGFA